MTLLAALELFARSGGGGSSSGGGSGGGGEVIALLGYFPSFYLGKLLKKLLSRKSELIVSAAFASIFSLALLAIGFNSGMVGTYFMICIVVGIWVGWGAAFFGVWERLQKKASQAKKTIDGAAALDSTWNHEQLLAHAKQIFLQYQRDWSTLNIASIQTYLTPLYARHSAYLLLALHELGRKNIMDAVDIKDCMIIDARDDSNDTNDSFTVAFRASALDRLVETDGKVLFEDTSTFIEHWRFVRSGDIWLLDGITQQTQNLASTNTSLQMFAQENSMFYSLDMGWLLLPTKGLLMARGKMGVSDINNHVVGTYNRRLVQLYTFTPVPSRQSTAHWLILQTTLPTSYGGIIVQRRKKWFSMDNTYIKPSKEYQKHTLEWQDFNKRYDVHATDADKLAAFELINPGFMSYLYDNDPSIGIEVTDSSLYLFKYLGPYASKIVYDHEYKAMLTIAMMAFKELRL